MIIINLQNKRKYLLERLLLVTIPLMMQSKIQITKSDDEKKPKKVVIGDTDDSPVLKKPKFEFPKTSNPSADYNDMLSKIYADKQIKSKIEEQRKENKLKEYEEFKSKGIFGKLGDESASDDEKDKQPVDNEKLWNVFAHKETVEKPIIKQGKRKPRKKEEFKLE